MIVELSINIHLDSASLFFTFSYVTASIVINESLSSHFYIQIIHHDNKKKKNPFQSFANLCLAKNPRIHHIYVNIHSLYHKAKN